MIPVTPVDHPDVTDWLEPLFAFTHADAQQLIADFHTEMHHGLSGKNSSLKMLPTFIGRPSGKETGRFLAMDLGGTNLRVIAVKLDGKGQAQVGDTSRFVIPVEIMQGAGDRLFDFLARCVQTFFSLHDFDPQRRYDLAFTFSFPVDQRAIASGSLIEWTKGFTASDVVGKDVVALLAAALHDRGVKNVRVCALANDTTGALMARAYGDANCDMGVILGTGSNACYPETRLDRLSGMSAVAVDEMIINMEWGNFDKLTPTEFDRMLDRDSPNPGRQWLEKMVSGMYLGELVRLVIVAMIDRGSLLTPGDQRFFTNPYSLTSAHLAQPDAMAGFGLEHIKPTDAQAIARIAELVFNRAARIAGTAIAAVVTWMDSELSRSHTIAVDGSLFEKYPGFRRQMLAIIDELYPERADHIQLKLTSDGSGTGAAIIAAVAAGQSHR